MHSITKHLSHRFLRLFVIVTVLASVMVPMTFSTLALQTDGIVSPTETLEPTVEVPAKKPNVEVPAVEPTAVLVEPTAVLVEPTVVLVEPTAVLVEPTAVLVESSNLRVAEEPAG